MKLPLHIAKKLQLLLVSKSSLPASAMQHGSVIKMLQDGILHQQQKSMGKAIVFIVQKESLAAYLHNHFGISSLEEYISKTQVQNISRATATAISGNSKLKKIRSFKGFLVNCYQPIAGILDGEKITLHPADGSFVFISDYENFRVDESVTVVGIENAENFRQAAKQQYLFQNINPLFVCRYPQSNDLIKWLKAIPNSYLHFGDLDFAGIDIYLSSYKTHLGNRASFFVPPNTEMLLQKFGNKTLFNKQYKTRDVPSAEQSIVHLYQLLIKYKLVLEQEIFIKN